MRTRIVAVAASVAAAGAGLFAGMGIAGGDDDRPVAEEVVLAEPLTGRRAGATPRRAQGPSIDFFYAAKPTVPEEGGSIVQQIRCPSGAGNPIAAGARTPEGIDLVYLSRAHPSDASRPKRSYFVGVEDVSDSNPADSGAFVEVQCARGISVRK
jgi:hypothetical protein